MTVHTAKISWACNDAKFVDKKYSRVHQWTFDGGAVVPASSSPLVVRVPFSDPAGVDPEEAFVASLSSCHMLWFLDMAARGGYVVHSYDDAAEGKVEKNAEGKEAMTTVTLRPAVVFGNGTPASDAAVAQLHHEAHENCFLASSVKSEIVIAGSWTQSA